MAKQTTIQKDTASAKSMVWLTTFNDMITLLMVFFVLLFSMGRLDVDRFKHFQNQLQSAMGVMYEGHKAPGGLISDQQGYIQDEQQDDTAVDEQNEQNFKTLAENEGLEAEYTPKGIQLILNDELLFRSGSARLTPSGLDLLSEISSVVKPINRHIRIEGHTDNRPIATTRYPSNWELSTARAISVVNYFIDLGIPASRLSAAGYGEVKPRVENNTDANRSKNRRVEIILGHIEPKDPETPSFEGE